MDVHPLAFQGVGVISFIREYPEPSYLCNRKYPTRRHDPWDLRKPRIAEVVTSAAGWATVDSIWGVPKLVVGFLTWAGWPAPVDKRPAPSEVGHLRRMSTKRLATTTASPRGV